MRLTHYENTSLEMIVGSSQLILVVEKREPFAGHEKVRIIPEGSIFSGKNNPPYYEPSKDGFELRGTIELQHDSLVLPNFPHTITGMKEIP